MTVEVKTLDIDELVREFRKKVLDELDREQPPVRAVEVTQDGSRVVTMTATDIISTKDGAG